MTANKIREVAMFYFSRDGYEGASLSQIAEDVGIRKPSLYAHYKSKEEIYFSCLDYALQNHLALLQQFVSNRAQMSVKEALYTLLVRFKEQAQDDVVSKFSLRALYFPPHVFKEQMTYLSTQHIIQIGQLLLPLFEQAKGNSELREDVEATQAVEAYLCLFDGLMIEYMHAGADRFHHRLLAAWPIFCTGSFN